MGKRSSSSLDTKAAAEAEAASDETRNTTIKKKKKQKKSTDGTELKTTTISALATNEIITKQQPPKQSNDLDATAPVNGNTESKAPSTSPSLNDDVKVNKKTNQDNKVTKRQKRKQLQQSEKNKWPQHPHIKSADARDQAYLRVAGLSKNSNNKKTKKAVVEKDVEANDMVVELRWGRCLASTEARTRHAAVQQLQNYLKAKCHPESGGGISELDLLKLCKALWYTLYLADHAVVQQELSQRLATLLWCLAGTPEEDEYAGQAYLEMLEEEAAAIDEDEDDDDVVMEVIGGDVDEEDYDDEDDDEELEGEDDYDDEEGEDDDDNLLQLIAMDDEKDDDKDDDDDDEDDDDHLQLIEMEAEEDDDDEEEDDDDDEQEEEDHANENDDDDDDGLEDSEIPHCRGAHLASLFVRTLFRTIRREWGHMDKYRIDKFYTLMRLVLEQMFTYMAQRHWNLGIIRLFNDTLVDEILTQTPNGLRNHLIDITLEELAKVNSNAEKAPIPLTEATFFDCMEPYLFLAQTGGSTGGRRRAVGRDDQIQARVLDRILVKFLNEYSVVSDNYDPHHVCHHGHDDDDDDDDQEERQTKNKKKTAEKVVPDEKEQRHHLVFNQVHVGSIAKALFDMASDGTITLNCYRKSLYDMHKMYIKRLTKVGRDVVLEMDESDDEEGEDADEDEFDQEDEFEDADENLDDEEEMNDRKTKKPRRGNEDNEDKPEKDKKNEKADKNKANNKKNKKEAKKKQATSVAEKQVNIKTNAADDDDDDDDESPESAKTTNIKTMEKKNRKRSLESAESTPTKKPEKVVAEKTSKANAKTLTPSDDVEPKPTSSEKKRKDKKQGGQLEATSPSGGQPAPGSSEKKKKTKGGKQDAESMKREASVKEMKPLQKQIEKAIQAMSPSKEDTPVSVVAKGPSTPDIPNEAASNESSKKKRKRNKGKQQQQAAEAEKAVEHEESVFTISLFDQKKASQAAAIQAVASNAKSTETPPAKAPKDKKNKSSEKSKRVSFGKLLSKSYASSISALRNMGPPTLFKKSPEEGILLNKDADPVVRRDLLGKNLGTEDRRKSKQNNQPRQMQCTKSVWTAPFTMTRKSPFRKNTGGANVRVPNQAKRRKASDYF